MSPTPADRLNVALVVNGTEAEGPGKRYALWVQGCPFRCRGCCNPEFLAFEGKGAADATVQTTEAILAEIAASDVEGVTFLGGEPFSQAPALARVAEAVQATGRTVMVFTGHTLDALRAAGAPPGAAELLAHTDLLVDGAYDETRRTTTRRWVGSDNQQMHFLTGRYTPDDPRFHEPNHVEIRLVGGRILLNGWPVDGARTRI